MVVVIVVIDIAVVVEGRRVSRARKRPIRTSNSPRREGRRTGSGKRSANQRRSPVKRLMLEGGGGMGEERVTGKREGNVD